MGEWVALVRRPHASELARTAKSVLLQAADTSPDSVRVMLEDGWIALFGEVAWEHQRLAAVGAVRYLAGVTGVSDQIDIKPLRL